MARLCRLMAGAPADVADVRMGEESVRIDLVPVSPISDARRRAVGAPAP